ncbi:MAG: helix-turn-helix transcriptional regulator [Williamsia sp.]|nr:helix-turn-helix transcriptional regulator [Williamsia sp.]
MALEISSDSLASKRFYHKDNSAIPSKVTELISFIQLNLQKQLTVSELAKKVNQHPDYFSRLFVQLTGERPLPYINGKRIERAQYLMTTSDMTVAEIAEETGFSSVPHFSKIFKQVTSLTPGQYRHQHQNLGNY